MAKSNESVVSWKQLSQNSNYNVLQYVPKNYNEHYTIKKPIGVRLHKQDGRITHVLKESILNGFACIGDVVIGVDGVKIIGGEQLTSSLMKKTESVQLQICHNTYSWCFHLRTTVEKIQIDREVERITSNPVNHYFVLIKVKLTPEQMRIDLGLTVKYNNRDRLEVSSVQPGSLAAVHLRAGDVIRECNGVSICSKTMLKYLVASSIANTGQFTIVVEAPIHDSMRDHIEVSDDVVQISDKQIEEFKKAARMNTTAPGRKSSHHAVKIKEDSTEHQIVSDMDPSKLKPCKNAS